MTEHKKKTWMFLAYGSPLSIMSNKIHARLLIEAETIEEAKDIFWDIVSVREDE